MLKNKKTVIIFLTIFIISALLGFGIYKYMQNNNVASEVQQQQKALASYDTSRFECSSDHMWEGYIYEPASDANHDNLKLSAVGAMEVGKPVDIEFKSEAGDWKQNSQITARICVSKTSPAISKTITIPNWSNRRDIMTHVFNGIIPEGECISGALFSTDPTLHMFSPPLFDYYKLCGFKKTSNTPTPTPSASPSPSGTPRVTTSPSPTPTRTPTITATPTASPTSSPTASPTGTPPVGGPSSTPTPTPTNTPATTNTPPPGATNTPSPTNTPPVVANATTTPQPDNKAVAAAEQLPQAGTDSTPFILLGAVSISIGATFLLRRKKLY